MRGIVVFGIVLAVGLCGCQKPTARLNAPPHGYSEEANPLQDEYEQMIDNALLADMTLSDIHFMPDRPMLSTHGEERLSRLAALLERYGGTIRFSTNADDKLVAARTERVMDYLTELGVDTTAQVMTRDLPASRGMDAAQAILIKVNEGTYIPKKKTSTNSGSNGSGGSADTGGQPKSQ
jgi:hypothetical protein